MDIMLYAILISILDQASKHAVKLSLNPYDSIPLIKGVFNITYVQNTGAAFSILRGKTHFFTVVTLIVITVIIYTTIKFTPKNKWVRVLIAFILGGAVGNLLDRLRYGYVVDFLDFIVFPVFNVADMAIVTGALLLAYFIAFDQNLADFYGKSRR
ncbi:MAG: signal peptidase II [Thermoanaerobacterales bacterium]|nr:signal peptidase II [Thermoanaerobacterales bacterium]